MSRCQTWLPGSDRCTAEATHVLFDGAGERIPGGLLCEEHGREVVSEYRLKLGWEWQLLESGEERRDG